MASPEFHRQYLVTLPLPLAQLYSRAHNAKDARGRHDNTFYLWEALIKLAAAPAITWYMHEVKQGTPRVQALDQLLGQLSLPSLGQWVAMLRELSRHFGQRPDAATAPLGHLWGQLTTKRRDLPAVLALFQRIKNGPDGQPAGEKSCTLLEVLDSLVVYRNSVFGHGAGRFQSFYEQEMGPLLFPAANEVLGEGVFDYLGPRGARLVYLTELKTLDEGRVQVSLLELVGREPERAAPLELTSSEAARLVPNCVAVVWPARPAPLRLDPLLIFRGSELSEEVLFLNRDRNGKQAEYLSYTTGRTERDNAMGPALARLLGQIAGRELVFVAGPDKGRTLSLTDGKPLLLGRGQTCDVMVDDATTSRVHCRIEIDGARVTLYDAGSTAGTFVWGKKITKVLLQPGDVFQLGETRIRYQMIEAVETPTVMGERAAKPAQDIVPRQMVEPVIHLLGKLVGQFQLDEVIAVGRSGVQFKGVDTLRNRVVAVKVLTPDLANSDEQRDRFLRAMKTMLPIQHPNIVRVYKAGKKGPYCWAAMEYVDGESLNQVIDKLGADAVLDWREVWRVAMHISRALETAFTWKIIHRNVTPTNIIRRNADKVCLLGDLMLAKALEGSQAEQVTQPGKLIGDLAYMAPERTDNESAIDGRSDIYGLGATLFALLTGRPAFQHASAIKLVELIRSQPVSFPPAQQASIDESFQGIVLKMLAKKPQDRYQSPAELLKELTDLGARHGLAMD